MGMRISLPLGKSEVRSQQPYRISPFVPSRRDNKGTCSLDKGLISKGIPLPHISHDGFASDRLKDGTGTLLRTSCLLKADQDYGCVRFAPVGHLRIRLKEIMHGHIEDDTGRCPYPQKEGESLRLSLRGRAAAQGKQKTKPSQSAKQTMGQQPRH